MTSTRRVRGGGSTLGVDRVGYDWNGIWDVATRITDEGWIAEIVIPFTTLRFQRITELGSKFQADDQT